MTLFTTPHLQYLQLLHLVLINTNLLKEGTVVYLRASDNVQVGCPEAKRTAGPKRVSPEQIHHWEVTVPVWRQVNAPQGGRTSPALLIPPRGRPNEAGMSDAMQGRVIECGMTDVSHRYGAQSRKVSPLNMLNGMRDSTPKFKCSQWKKVFRVSCAEMIWICSLFSRIGEQANASTASAR